MCNCLAEHRENGVGNDIVLMKDQRTNFCASEMNEYEDDEDNVGSKKELDRKSCNFELNNEIQGDFDEFHEESATEGDDIYSQLAQKEKDLLLAAELGKALLERNEELSKHNEALQEELVQRNEELKQEKHDFRLKIERVEGFHESTVHELQADLQALRNELNSVKSASVSDLEHKKASFARIQEDNERLQLELQQIKNGKSQLAEELASARKRLARTKSVDNGIHAALAEVEELQEKLQRLSEERNYFQQTSKELETARNALAKENAELLERNRTIESKLAETKTQCANFEEELDESKLVNTSLRSQLDELKMQASLGTSLYSELSMIDDEEDDDDLEDDKNKPDKVFTAVGQSLKPVQSLNGTPNPIATSSSISVALTTNTNKRQRKASSFMDESDNSDIEFDEMDGSITSVTRDSHVLSKLEAEELANAELKREVFEAHSELTDLYEHLRSSCESLQSLNDVNMKGTEQNKFKPGCLTAFVHNFKECIKELAKSEQEHLRSVDTLKMELCNLKKNLDQVAQEVLFANSKMNQKDKEIEELQLKIERQENEIEILREQRKKLAIEQNKDDLARDVLYAEMGREREAALKRESDVTEELVKTKRDNAGLDEQLLEAIQQKIELSEQLEQWQYDMASLIDDQVKRQMKTLAMEQEALRSRKRLTPFSKGWNWSISHRRQNVQH